MRTFIINNMLIKENQQYTNISKGFETNQNKNKIRTQPGRIFFNFAKIKKYIFFSKVVIFVHDSQLTILLTLIK